MFFKKNTNSIEWLVVCLGNPGDKYDNTRHNIGFMVADYMAKEESLSMKKIKFKALITDITFDGTKALLMKPVTFMNLSGEAVRQAADYYKIPPERILVVSDEVAFPVGKLKIGKKGSAGGHNGLKNIIQHLGTDAFPRIRVGVGEKPHPDYDMADWVLGHFSKEDNIEAVVKDSAQAVSLAVSQGLDKAMAQYNGNVKGKGITRKASPQDKTKLSKAREEALKDVRENTLLHQETSGEQL